LYAIIADCLLPTWSKMTFRKFLNSSTDPAGQTTGAITSHHSYSFRWHLNWHYVPWVMMLIATRSSAVLLFLLSLSCHLTAQVPVTLSGRVIDISNNQPIPGVNIYFDNTMVGASTNGLGEFFIKRVPSSPPMLVISAIGYRTVHVPSLDVSSGLPITIEVKLVPEATTLAPITISAGKVGSDWSGRYRAFRRILLGTTSNGLQCKILNPEVISFSKIDSLPGTEIFSAHAIAPIEIENRGLGYKLTVTLNEFKSLKHSYSMLFTTKFDSLTTGNERERLRWQHNRIESYKGSLRHFFTSIISGTYIEEGFRVFYAPDDLSAMKTFGTYDLQNARFAREALIKDLVVDTTAKSMAVLRKGTFQIHYHNKIIARQDRSLRNEPTPVSWIRVSDPYLRLQPYGEIMAPANFLRAGYMNELRLGDFLPYDYEVKHEELNEISTRLHESVVVRGTVIDEKGLPLPGVDVFINKGITHTRTNEWGNFELPALDPGKYPIVFARDATRHDTLVVVDCTAGIPPPVNVTLRKKPFRKVLPDDRRESHEKAFVSYLLKPSGTVWDVDGLINPGVVQFETKSENLVEVWSTAPLIIENLSLGYQWTLFIRSGTMTPKEMDLDAYIMMDTIAPLKPWEARKWENNRLKEYLGSWNHFMYSLQYGTTAKDGFNIYQVNRDAGKRKPRFKKMLGKEAIAVEGDSIFSPLRGNIFLKTLPGLEVHNENKRGGKKFYRGVSDEVLRLSATADQVAVTRHGIFDPWELNIVGARRSILAMVPVDFSPLERKTSSDILLLVKEESLKTVRYLLEKVHVHTDRSHYYPGDTIWMKASLRYSTPALRDSLSKVLYVDLLDPAGRTISASVLKITEGQARGTVLLDMDLPAGNYYLRAYTNWMRNFDEVFITPLPIISGGQFVEGQMHEGVVQDGPVHAVLTSDKEVYTTGSQVKLKLALTENGASTGGTFSISVTDQSAVPELTSATNISQLIRPFKADKSNFIRITHPAEKGITINGEIPGAKDGILTKVWLLIKKDSTAAMTTTTRNSFRISLDFNDTTTAVVKATHNGNYMRTSIPEAPPLYTIKFPDPLKYKLASQHGADRTLGTQNDSSRILPEVTVRARRIIAPQPMFKTPTQQRFGFPVRVGEGEAIKGVRDNLNLFDYLRTLALVKFTRTLCVLQGGTTSSMNIMNPAFTNLVAGCGRPGDPLYEFYFNGRHIDLSEVNGLPLANVSRIEAYTVTSYAIAIYTEDVIPYRVTDYDQYKVRGYDPPVAFKVPAESKGEPDTRATVYWNPDVKVDEHGEASVSFPTTDVDGTYKVVIEGMTASGSPFRAVKYLKVE
jgi:hypothetical protein